MQHVKRARRAQVSTNVHTFGTPTRHLDLRFLVRAPVGAQPVRSHESDDLRYWPVDALPDTAERETIDHLVALARMRD